jgi:DinB family protein
MDLMRFIDHSLNQAHERFLATLAGLGEDALVWRPMPHANTIIEIVWHVVRADDRLGRTRSGLGPEVWSAQKWHRRFDMPEDANPDAAYQFVRDSAAIPSLAAVIDYANAIHVDTRRRLAALDPSDLDRVPDFGRPQWTVAACFRHMITHKNHHHGQIDFIRGLHQQGWDLPPGTAVRQG